MAASHQLAVGTKAGVEAVVHGLRQWWGRNRNNNRVVLVKNDYENAFNEADPRKFLESGRRHMPGSARLAEWCYGGEVNLVYHGRVRKSSRGQQGCPLMMPLFCAMKKDMRDRVGGCEDLSFVADFADDGVLGGDYEAVLKVLKAEAALGGEYGLRNNFSKMKVYTVAGESFEGDLAGFESLGIPIDKSCNVEFMKVPIVGDRLFLKAWGEEKLRDIRKTLTAIERLASKHVGLYLFRTAANVCKI